MAQEEMLTTSQAASELGMTVQEVRSLLTAKVLPGVRNNRRWQIPKTALEEFKFKHVNFQRQPSTPKDTGILQITFGLTGLSAVIMTLLPSSVVDITPASKIIIFFIALVVAIFSLIASLMMLGQYLESVSLLEMDGFETLPYDLGYIFALFKSPPLPYRLLTLSLLLLVIGLIIASFFILAYS